MWLQPLNDRQRCGYGYCSDCLHSFFCYLTYRFQVGMATFCVDIGNRHHIIGGTHQGKAGNPGYYVLCTQTPPPPKKEPLTEDLSWINDSFFCLIQTYLVCVTCHNCHVWSWMFQSLEQQDNISSLILLRRCKCQIIGKKSMWSLTRTSLMKNTEN